MSTDIATYLLSKKASPEAAVAENRKIQWIENLKKLYANINAWIDEARGTGAITDYSAGEFQITEEKLGSYLVPEMSFSTGAASIRFIPKGTYVISADGRVDVYATTGRDVSLLIKDGRWFYVDPRTHKHPELTEEVFLELLKFLLESREE